MLHIFENNHDQKNQGKMHKDDPVEACKLLSN